MFLMVPVVRAAAVSVLLLMSATGCKGSDEKQASSAAIDPQASEQIVSQEDDLLARRDALFNMRRDLQQERETLAQQREVIREQGGDTAEIDEKSLELLEREGTLVAQEQDLNEKYEQILAQRRAMMAALSTGGPVDDVSAREASLAARERTVASREDRLGQREAALAQREESLASKWKDSCSVSAPPTVVQMVDAKGSKYSKRDVEPLLGKARSAMSKKGILASDLPPEAQALEGEATKAMAEGDYGRARFAADQLLRTVRGMKIDKAFIAAKIGRLNGQMKGKGVGGDKRERVDKLFREATSLYGDANFAAANARLNTIYGEIR